MALIIAAIVAAIIAAITLTARDGFRIKNDRTWPTTFYYLHRNEWADRGAWAPSRDRESSDWLWAGPVRLSWRDGDIDSDFLE